MKDKLNVVNEEPWYKEGLNFKCTECGGCCTGSPGYIWVNDKEIEEIASFLKLSIEDFYKKYLRKVGHRYSILERPQTYDCVFLKDKKCTIYSVRPKQCRTFPWWTQNLKSKEDWLQAASYCEGINSEAPKVPFEHIQSQLHQL